MNLALAAVEEAEYFSTEAEDIKYDVEESGLEEVAEVDLDMAMKEEETIGVLDKILKWCDAMTDHNFRFTRHMNSLTMNDTG